MKLQTVDWEILIFFQKERETSFFNAFCAWFFKKKYFSVYIPLVDQISLPDCLYFLGYMAICVFPADIYLLKVNSKNTITKV